MKIAISVESTNDLSKELIAEYDISVIPYTVSVGDKVFKDGEYTTLQVFDMVDKTGILPKTTAINEFEYAEYFKGLRSVADAVVHVCLSSALSSSCSNAQRAAEELDNVYVVDSKTLSTGIGLLAIYARELANAGVSPDEIAKKLEERREKLQVSFVVERLDYLYKGGRCSGFQLLGANVLKIRPKLKLVDGKMIQDKTRTYRGGDMGKIMAKYANDVFEECPTPDLDKVFVTCTSCTPEMREAAVSACRAMGFKNVYETSAGATVGSHCGANTMGILFFNDGAAQ